MNVCDHWEASAATYMSVVGAGMELVFSSNFPPSFSVLLEVTVWLLIPNNSSLMAI